MIRECDGERKEIRNKLLPVSVLGGESVSNLEALTEEKDACVSFQTAHCAEFEKKGAWVLLDYGKELCGGLRVVTRASNGNVRYHITFGESVAEACSHIDEKNATNDHSPRDVTVCASNMSDLTFGQTGFRFARIELADDGPVLIQSIFAVSVLPYFEQEARISTSDSLLNRIIETAAYTLKLNCQNGFIWDGIKRDRLVWCGDLNPEILTSLYLFGDNANVTRSLTFLRNDTSADAWVNGIPAYSAWWVVNLCDYRAISGNTAYFESNRDYALRILEKIDSCIGLDGTMDFGAGAGMPFYLDWPTYETPDAVTGTAALMCLAAERYAALEDNPVCRSIVKKLTPYLAKPTKAKQIRAFQILAGRKPDGDAALLENGGAAGLSTFMAYYILKADAAAGGSGMLSMIREYYGGMLSRGATTFWEDFDLSWLPGSGRIDRLPEAGEKDLHGDFGKYCYQGFRHSLCHGWSSGVLAFVVEYIAGIKTADGFRTVTVHPHPLGLAEIRTSLPTPYGRLCVSAADGKVKVDAPAGIKVIRD